MSNVPRTIGRYQVVKILGSGGMGTLYLARDPSLDRQVAIKLLLGDFQDTESRERFAHEARAEARLRHPNIVTIFDVGDDAGRPFIVMEYVEGRTLAHIIHRALEIPISRKLTWIEQLCDGLAHAHRFGIVHRDIKPSNLMIDDHDALKILDFGIARLVSSGAATATDLVVGTPRYMSPEQVMGRRADTRSDIFSVGLVMYELLSYQAAFPGDTIDGILYPILSEPPTSLLTVCPGVDPRLVHIVEKALQKDPDRRYQGLEQLGADVGRVRRVTTKSASVPAKARFTLGADPPNSAPMPSHKGVDELTAEFAAVSSTTAVRARLDDRPMAVAHARSPGLWRLVPDAIARSVRAFLVRRRVRDDQGSPSPPTDLEGSAESARTEMGDATMLVRPVAAATSDRDDSVPTARILVVSGPDPATIGHASIIEKQRFTIGRDRACDLSLADSEASRTHAEIQYADGEFRLLDLGSANGTLLNGRRVTGQSATLLFGAAIRIGSTGLTFSYGRDTRLPDLVGSQIDGRYRLKRILRESAQSAVYEAADMKVPRDVAVKLLSPELCRFGGYRGRLEREAEAAARLSHPNICKLFECGQATISLLNGSLRTYFICYELMHGSLADRIKSKDVIPLETIAGWISVVADALDYSHSEGVVHGNLKPSAIVSITNSIRT